MSDVQYIDYGFVEELFEALGKKSYIEGKPYFLLSGLLFFIEGSALDLGDLEVTKEYVLGDYLAYNVKLPHEAFASADKDVCNKLLQGTLGKLLDKVVRKKDTRRRWLQAIAHTGKDLRVAAAALREAKENEKKAKADAREAREAMAPLAEQAEAYEQQFEQLRQEPQTLARIDEVYEDAVRIQDAVFKFAAAPELKAGDYVTCINNVPFEQAPAPKNKQELRKAYVESIAPGLGILLDNSDILFTTAEGVEPKPKDMVLVDGSKIVKVLPRDATESKHLVKVAPLGWDDIGGLTKAKEALRDAIETPRLYRELYESYGAAVPAGVLLWGPPGCGKTMLGKAAANALAGLSGGKKAGFFYVKGPEMLDKYVGETERHIRELFADARDFEEKNGYPACIFIDEAEAILGHRGTGLADISVPSFLVELDGLEKSGAFVILATNLPDALDDAVIRDGRIDRKIEITRPTEEAAGEIVSLYLDKKKLVEGLQVGDAVEHAVAEFFKHGVLRDKVNGAMLRNIAEFATTLALKDDIAAGNTEATGLTKEHITKAVGELKTQNNQVLEAQVSRGRRAASKITGEDHDGQEEVETIEKALKSGWDWRNPTAGNS